MSSSSSSSIPGDLGPIIPKGRRQREESEDQPDSDLDWAAAALVRQRAGLIGSGESLGSREITDQTDETGADIDETVTALLGASKRAKLATGSEEETDEPNWDTLRNKLLQAPPLIHGVAKGALLNLVETMRAHRTVVGWGNDHDVLRIRPSEVASWGLPYTVETSTYGVIAVLKVILGTGTSKKVRMGLRLDTLGPVAMAKVRMGRGLATENKVLHELEMLDHVEGEECFVQALYSVRYIAKDKVTVKYGIAMEFCNGGELFDSISTHGSRAAVCLNYNLSNFMQVVTDLTTILTRLEDLNMIHRDLKPENLMLTVDEGGTVRVKAADLGFADKIGEARPRMCGTPGYVAPEMYANDVDDMITFGVDVWSMGVVLFTLLVGGNPWTETIGPHNPSINQEQINGRLAFARAKARDRVPPCLKGPEADGLYNALFDLIGKMLILDPSARATASRVARDWESAKNAVRPAVHAQVEARVGPTRAALLGAL